MNTYENAVPKPLKFLVSDGKLVDDAGNVIAESESLKDLYTKWNPEIKKYLLSDGSVVDENNNLIIKNDYYKKMYDQADPKIAKYLHSDGTVDENPGSSSGADLEDNHQTTIDVSTYNTPVEVTPTQGKDGMKKVTVTLNNVPSPTINAYNFYYWKNEEDYTGYFTLSENPQVGDNAYLENDGGTPDKYATPSKITSVSGTSIDIDYVAISRDGSGDITYTKS